jgi:hypothetical protein
MAAPVSMPSAPTAVPSVWRAISSLRFLRRLLGIPSEPLAQTSPARAPVSVGHGTFDWDGPDTSLTQAELEVLK